MTIKEIKQLVDDFKGKLLPKQVEGQAYYRGENLVINERKKMFFNLARGDMREDFTKANNRLASGFTKKIVDQKVMYSVNANMTIDDLDIDIDKFKRKLKAVAKNASNEYYGVIQWYIDNDNQLKFKVIDSKQIIVVYDLDDEDEIKHIVRCYKREDFEYVEVYDENYKDTYVIKDGDYILESRESSLSVSKVANGRVITTEEFGWGKPPFAILNNNEEHQNDLQLFKAYVDMYDIVMSDFGNNFEDYQEMYWVLKNYNGQDATSFVKEFKESRILKVSGEGDAKQVAQEVPAMSRETFLKLLKKDIYSFGMAVDMEAIKGDVTNEAIRAMYSDLDLKANDFEMEITDFFSQCLYFINRYNEINNIAEVESEITFTRDKIINEKDAIESILSQVGFRAKVQLLKQMPNVTDVEEELEALKLEQAEQVTELETPFEE